MNTPRIIVLGADIKTAAVTSYPWARVPEDLNLSDYDVAIFNLVSLQGEPVKASTPVEVLDEDRVLPFLLKESNELVVIANDGDLPIEFAHAGRVGHGWKENNYWLPLAPRSTDARGDSVVCVNPEFKFYFDLVRRYTQCFDKETPLTASLSPGMAHVPAGASEIAGDLRPLATNAAGQMISFELRFIVVAVESRQPNWIAHRDGPPKRKVLGKSGTILWLPAPTEGTVEDAVRRILDTRYQVHLGSRRPSWLRFGRLPVEQRVELEVQELERQRQELESRLSLAAGRLENERKAYALLYEQGEPLEQAVRESLRILRLPIKEPLKRGTDDGRAITQDDAHLCFEVKGRTGSIQLADVRQADHWAREAAMELERDVKAVLIANAYCEIDPTQRAHPFPANCIDMAARFGACLLTTGQIFDWLAAHQRGEFNPVATWRAVAACNGVFTDPPKLG